MQRNISRRDLGKRLAGGAALLALQPAWNYLAAAQSLRNDLKDLKGELYFDDAALQAAADDFGHVVPPVVALRLRTFQLPISWSLVVACWAYQCEGGGSEQYLVHGNPLAYGAPLHLP